MPPCRVLIVDDDPPFLEVLADMFNGRGYDVCRASGPREALDMIQNHTPFDLVLSDVAMQEMQGTDLVREIVHLRPKIACVLMTGGLFDATQLPPGIQLLHKPFLRSDLFGTIQQAIATSQSREQSFLD